MAKDNMLLGQARGKVGDLVFSRQSGQQVIRARNRHPKNPKTPLQLLQRVIAKTVSNAYSVTQEITNHSFQGLQEGTPNQSRFFKVNVQLLRQRLASLINDGDAEAIISSTEANFNGAADSLPAINAYQISEGHLPSIGLVYVPTATEGGYGGTFKIPLTNLVGASSYQQVVDALGLQRGDQLTFCVIGTDDSSSAQPPLGFARFFKYCRVILEPSDGDMTKAFISSSSINDPNPRNEGALSLTNDTTHLIITRVAGLQAGAVNTANTIVGMAVIVSRQSGNTWERSTESFLMIPSGVVGGSQLDYNDLTLGDAVLSYMQGTDSSLYLNQAESGY